MTSSIERIQCQCHGEGFKAAAAAEEKTGDGQRTWLGDEEEGQRVGMDTGRLMLILLLHLRLIGPG